MLTGVIGPNAMQVLSEAGVKMVTGVQGSVRDAVEDFRNGKLKSTPTASYAGRGFWGRGGGPGMGMGRSTGRGRGMYSDQYQPSMTMVPQSSVTEGEEKEALTRHLEELEKQLTGVKKRLEELK